MRILLTGASGYFGSNLLPLLLEKGHEVLCLIRNPKKIGLSSSNMHIVGGNLLDIHSLKNIPKEIDAAYYLVHSISQHPKDFEKIDLQAAKNFAEMIDNTSCKQIVYLSGIVNEQNLSKHLQSRLEVEQTLRKRRPPVTTLRAGIIIGSGSASFETMRNLVEKLSVMMAPKWAQKQASTN